MFVIVYRILSFQFSFVPVLPRVQQKRVPVFIDLASYNRSLAIFADFLPFYQSFVKMFQSGPGLPVFYFHQPGLWLHFAFILHSALQIWLMPSVQPSHPWSGICHTNTDSTGHMPVFSTSCIPTFTATAVTGSASAVLIINACEGEYRYVI